MILQKLVTKPHVITQLTATHIFTVSEPNIQIIASTTKNLMHVCNVEFKQIYQHFLRNAWQIMNTAASN
jgi:hypothetical protein